jgi:hypothetical protein
MKSMFAVEMLGRYGQTLAQAWPWALLAILVAAALAQPRLWYAADHAPSAVQRLFVLFAMALSMILAWRLAWVCDDAFISFRYADNLVHGRGLVWNPGERVEGFTNFLWTLVLAGAIRLGLDPVQGSVVFGLMALVATLLAMHRLRAQILPDGLRGAFPLAVVALAVQHTFTAFGTSGLETMLAAGLALWAVERVVAGRVFLGSLLGVLAAMAHPDHGILWFALGCALALHPEKRKQVLRYALPLVLVYLPYFLARFAYYGHAWPNTYYAKSGGGMYFSQGLRYWMASLLGDGLWAILPFAVFGAWQARRTLFGCYAMLALPLYGGYVAKIGGDYMVGRLLVALLPMFFLCAELGVRRLAEKRRSALLVGCLAFALTALPTSLVRSRAIEWNLADERTHTPLVSFAPPRIGSNMFDRARLFQDRLSKAGLRPVLCDYEIGMMGYYTGLDLIDIHGLTDVHVARRPLAQRGRPGHERWADTAYLRERGVALARTTLWEGRYKPVTRILFPDGSVYFFGYWQPQLAEALRTIKGVVLTDAPTFLDQYLAQADKLPADVARQDLRTFFEPYYFAHTPDPARRARFDRYRAEQ